MSEKCKKQKSPRHGFVFSEMPTVKASCRGGSSSLYETPTSYGAVLDCVFEMADQIATGNGVPPDAAITKVLKDEGWRLLPTHRAEILKRLQ